VTISSDGGESCTGAVSDGGCSITFGVAGSFNLSAAYSGDASFDPSTSDPEKHEVAAPPPAGLRAAGSTQSATGRA
jgi:hypothetical protein